MELSAFHTEMKAAFGNAKIHLVETESNKRCGSIDLNDGTILCISDSHKDILVAQLRDKFSDLVGEILGDILVAQPDVEPDAVQESGIDLSHLSPVPGKKINDSIFDADHVQKGIIGEQRTAGVLSVLMNNAESRILHSVDLKTRDIDHVFFSTRGIFVINSKYRRSTERVVRDFTQQWSSKVIDDAREIAQITSRFLDDTEIATEEIYHPRVVLWSEPSFEVETTTERSCILLHGDHLVEHIMSMREVMSADTAIGMYEMLRLRIKSNSIH